MVGGLALVASASPSHVVAPGSGTCTVPGSGTPGAHITVTSGQPVNVSWDDDPPPAHDIVIDVNNDTDVTYGAGTSGNSGDRTEPNVNRTTFPGNNRTT